jgi:hypothetical protein
MHCKGKPRLQMAIAGGADGQMMDNTVFSIIVIS